MSDTEMPPAIVPPDCVAPAEDAGPDTQVRYRFQYQVAAAHCFGNGPDALISLTRKESALSGVENTGVGTRAKVKDLEEVEV